MNLTAVLKTIRQETENALQSALAETRPLSDPKEREILRIVRDKGYYVVPNFYSEEYCMALRAEIDRLFSIYPTKVQADVNNSDHRLFGADRASSLIKAFYEDAFIRRIMEAHERTQNLAGLTLAARLDFVPGNHGSGDGWHRDSSAHEQIKSIVYLSDVTLKNGPFEYIEGSHRPLVILADLLKNNFTFNQNRFTNGEIETLLACGNRKQKRTSFLAKAGTLILVNTRGLHRGAPIQESVRYALTNYVWSNRPIPAHIAKLAVHNV